MSRKIRFHYEKRRVRGSLNVNQLTNLGIYSNLPAHFKVITFRLEKRLCDLKRWKFVDYNEGATFFKLPNGAKVVVKPEVWVPWPPMKYGKRQSKFQPRRMLTILNELVRRKVNIEVPLGELITKEGSVFYITKFEKGVQLVDYLRKEPPISSIRLVAKSMGDFLADIHNKGVVQMHPHDRNWLIHGNKAKLIDVKEVIFREEFPWHTNARRTYTFEAFAEAEVKATASWLPEQMRGALFEEYARRLRKKE